MGHVYTEVKVGDASKRRAIECEMLVDTGATYLCLSPQLAEELGLHIETRTAVTLADKREIEAGLTLASIKINDRESVVKTLVFDISEPVIGAFTLEELGLALDPVLGKLKPTRSFITRV